MNGLQVVVMFMRVKEAVIIACVLGSCKTCQLLIENKTFFVRPFAVAAFETEALGSVANCGS
jgi:hypothetical protein